MITIKTKDKQKALRMIKADDMASALWEIVNNGWRKFKHTDYDYQPAWDQIRDILEEYNINVNEIWQ